MKRFCLEALVVVDSGLGVSLATNLGKRFFFGTRCVSIWKNTSEKFHEIKKSGIRRGKISVVIPEYDEKEENERREGICFVKIEI